MSDIISTIWSSDWMITRTINGRSVSKPIGNTSPKIDMAAKMNFISNGIAIIHTADYNKVVDTAFAFPMFSEQGRPVFIRCLRWPPCLDPCLKTVNTQFYLHTKA